MSAHRSIRSFFKPSGTNSAAHKPVPVAERPVQSPARNSNNVTTNGNHAASISFSSTQASSKADTSFASSSSKRVIADGEEVVLPSESEEESDDSLEDIATVLGLNVQPPPAPPAVSTPVRPDPPSSPVSEPPTTAKKQGLRQRRAEPVRRKDDLLSRPDPKLVYSLSSLVNISKRAADTDERIAQVKSKFVRSKEVTEGANTDVDAGTLADAIDGDEKDERAKRLMDAMRRTDALTYDVVYHFFERSAPTRPTSNPFPRKHMPKFSWTSLLNKPHDRAETFTSGYASSMVAFEPLPDDVLLWILDEILVERREDLLYAYVTVLERSGAQAAVLLTADRLRKLFSDLGAGSYATEPDTPQPISRQLPESEPDAPPQKLKWVTHIIHGLAPSFDRKVQLTAILTLSRLSIDNSVLSYGFSHGTVRDTLAVLIDALPASRLDESFSYLVLRLNATLTPLALRQKIISSLPSSSVRQHTLRRHLSLYFFLSSTTSSPTPPPQIRLASSGQPLAYTTSEDRTSVLRNLSSPTLHDIILHRLTSSPLFAIHPETDFEALSAAITLLDTALDSGFVDLTSISNSKQQRQKVTQDRPSSASSATSSLSMTSTTPSQGENSNAQAAAAGTVRVQTTAEGFNRQLDAITAALRRIASSIVDGGAVGMSRIEAKAGLERLSQRIEFTVRIGGPARKQGLFEEDRSAMRAKMNQWLSEAAGKA